jgi:hypothetical protein
MKNNIIYLRPQQYTQAMTGQGEGQGDRIRIETEAGFGFVDSLLLLWLGAWSLYAGFACLQATGSLAF